MKNLIAAKISHDLQDLCQGRLVIVGRVHSVFDSALNVLLADGGLATVMAASRRLVPRGIALNRDISFSETVAVRDGQDVDVVIDLRRAQTVCLAMPKLTSTAIDPSYYSEGMHTIARAIAESEYASESLAPLLCHIFEPAPYHFVHNVYSEFLNERIRRFYIALSSPDIAADKVYFSKMGADIAGCGAGLTPSSDDFLVGVFAALFGAAAAGMLEHRGVMKLCRAVSDGAAPRTTQISANFIISGANGNFSETIIDVTAAFFSSRTFENAGVHSDVLQSKILEAYKSELADTAARLCAYGSTSGADTLTGLWFGLAAVSRLVRL